MIMRIGIDIDNTLCDTDLLAKKIYKEKNNGKDLSDLDKYSQYQFIGNNAEQIFDYCPLIENAKRVINDLFKDNEIYFISARANKHVALLEERTVDYLKKNGIEYTNIYFGHDSKIDMYRKLNLDIMLDDDYDVYNELISANLKTVMFNGSLNKNKDGIKVNSWLEFEEYIKKEVYNGK